jgi:RNA polymerase sigma-70 factor (ECF subfamily)
MSLISEELLGRMRSGEEAAWTEFYEAVRFPLARFLFRRLSNEHDVKDAMQATLVDLVRTLPRVKDPVHLMARLFMSARHRAVDLYRKNENDRLTDSIDEDPETGGEARSAEASLAQESELDHWVRIEALHRTLDTLGDPCRKLLLARHADCRSYKELAEMFGGASEGAMRKRLFDCMTALKKIWKRITFEEASKTR